jgi:hypothetical protein
MFENLRRKGYPSLPELELNAVLGESSDEQSLGDFENPSINFFWSHYKIPPAWGNPTISREVAEGSEEACFKQVGSKFVKSFFPKGSIFLGGDMVGTILITGSDYLSLLSEVQNCASYFSGWICGPGSKVK